MTTQYAEEQGFKKKYLAPLIVLMLCAVSLTGAAYAYSTSVTNTGDISGDYISIDMYEKGTEYTVLEKHLKADNFKVSTAKTVGTDAKYVATVEAGKLIYTTYVMISSDLDNPTFALSGTVTYTAPTTTGAGLVFSDITSGTEADLKSFMAIEKDDGTAATFDSLSKDVYYKVTITFTIDNAKAFGEYSTVDDLKAAVEAYTTDAGFTFTLKADLN